MGLSLFCLYIHDLRLKVCQQDLKRCQDLLREAQKKLALEKDKATAANGRILKLERRLIFVTKVLSVLILTVFKFASS